MTQAAMSPRFRATLIILLAVLINGTMIHWCWTLYRDMGLMNIAWTRTSEVSIEKATSLAQIERSIGYGEFIHNFKNYVLRRTPNYDQRTQASLEKVEDAIEGMRALSLQAEDREDLQTISQTVDTYRKNFLRAREADWRALPPAELDRLVYVDDSAAVAAFTAMRDRILPAYMSQMQTHERQISQVWREVATGALLIIPLILLNCAVCIWGGLKLIRRRGNDIMIFEGSSDAILVCDEQGQILRNNQIAEQMFEYGQDELRNRQLADIIPDLDVLFGSGSGAHRNSEKALASKPLRNLKARTKAGRHVPVAISVSSVLFFRRAAKMVVVREAA